MSEHPGGELVILTSASKDAFVEFNMTRPPDVIEKYAPVVIIGIAGAASAVVAHGGGGVVAAPASKYKGNVLANIGPGATWMARASGA